MKNYIESLEAKTDAAIDAAFDQERMSRARAETIRVMTSESYEVTKVRQAQEIQEQAAAMRNKERPQGRYTIEEAIILLLAETGDYYRLGNAVETGGIPCYENESGDKIGDPNDLRSYVCWDDLNKWIKEKTNIRDFKFPPPAAPAAPASKVATVERSITKQQVINAFEGLHLDRNGWDNALSDVPKWIEPCRVSRGRKGDKSTSATWNPVLIATALFDKEVPIKKLHAVFVDLPDWADEWREAYALFHV
jgi:hypothetical protein